MNEQQGIQSHSSRYLAMMLLRFWLGSSLLIASVLLLFNLAQRQQDLIREAERFVTLVHAGWQAALSRSQLEHFLDNSVHSLREERLNGLNEVLILDRHGVVSYSGIPAWRQLRIDDPLINFSGSGGQDFQRLVRCFRAERSDCLAIRSHDSGFHSTSFSVIRPVELHAQPQLNLDRQRLLVIVNFDPGEVLLSLVGDLPLTLLLASLLAGLLCLVFGSTLQRQLMPRLRDEAQTDGLTRLMNRTLFMELAKDLLAEAEQSGVDMVFAILDLDHFKRINDTYGHVCGDAALAEVGELLATVSRPEDLLCRFGGEEFALLLNGSREAGAKDLERLRLQLEMTKLNHAGYRIPLQASFGAAATRDCGYNLDYLYTCADQALYVAKQSGRNRVSWNYGEQASRLLR
jgi:diguanylate cyclase (GGDEF)-like protein